MTTITTSAGRLVAIGNKWLGVLQDPDPRTCSYTHFDLTVEQLGQTGRYNCWGFTFLARRYWILSSVDVDNIIADNCVEVNPGQLWPGDVIRYRDANDVTTHTGRVWEVDAAGMASRIRSKWGQMGEYLHAPLDVPAIYGTDVAFFRQISPLRGIGDLFIRDSVSDDGGQSHLASAAISSPDILVDGSSGNPVAGSVAQIAAVVHNRGDQVVDGAFVRYFSVDPASLQDPAKWFLIPSTSGHPNPAGPFSVPANGEVVAPGVEWLPPAAGVSVALVVVAYVNDDPQDVQNPDPIVYPFTVAWDNNTSQRVVRVQSKLPVCSPLIRDLGCMRKIRDLGCVPTVRDLVCKIRDLGCIPAVRDMVCTPAIRHSVCSIRDVCRVTRDVLPMVCRTQDVASPCSIRDVVIPCGRDIGMPGKAGTPVEQVMGTYNEAKAACFEQMQAMRESGSSAEEMVEALERLALGWLADASEAIETARELRGAGPPTHVERLSRR